MIDDIKLQVHELSVQVLTRTIDCKKLDNAEISTLIYYGKSTYTGIPLKKHVSVRGLV